ncbi:inositol-1-monophosphatase, partial [Proteus mirabilis]
DPIIGGEVGLVGGEDPELHGVLDLFEGTTTFIKPRRHVSVFFSARINGRTEGAVVYVPMRNELCSAVRGQGAQLNGYRLRGSNARDLDGAVLATGFPFKAKQHSAAYMNMLTKLFVPCADFRRTGSAALDLAYVAAGRVDGFFEIGLKPWDFLAGELIAREAGAIVSDFTGNHGYLQTGNIVAGNPRVVRALLAEIRSELTDALKR